MAGAGVEVNFDAEYQNILKAMERMAHPDKRALMDFVGKELLDITETAFERESNPATGAKWSALKNPRKDGSTNPILQDKGTLVTSIRRELMDDSVMIGSNLIYARIHQAGGYAGRGKKTAIPGRPYLGIPRDFDRLLLDDPYIQRLLGI
jgi:phage virion morphogenesis protein